MKYQQRRVLDNFSGVDSGWIQAGEESEWMMNKNTAGVDSAKKKIMSVCGLGKHIMSGSVFLLL